MGESIKSYRDLKVWQEAMNLAEACSRITKNFPRVEFYGMTTQIRRASASIAAISQRAMVEEIEENISNFIFDTRFSQRARNTFVTFNES